MWFPKTLRASRPHERARGRRASRAGYGLLLPLFLLPALLSGCGGGGGGINSTSSSDQGFRIVPAGGDVVPNFADDGTPAHVTLTAQPNAVIEGARVDLSHHTLTGDESMTLTNQIGKPVGSLVYSLVLTPRPGTFGSQVHMTVTLDTTTGPVTDPVVAKTIKIYTYDAAAKSWVVLPGSFTGSANGGTVTGRMVFPSIPSNPSDPKSISQNAMSDSGVYVVAYDVVPALPTGI